LAAVAFCTDAFHLAPLRECSSKTLLDDPWLATHRFGLKCRLPETSE
jgi:hypothetical protein